MVLGMGCHGGDRAEEWPLNRSLQEECAGGSILWRPLVFIFKHQNENKEHLRGTGPAFPQFQSLLCCVMIFLLPANGFYSNLLHIFFMTPKGKT